MAHVSKKSVFDAFLSCIIIAKNGLFTNIRRLAYIMCSFWCSVQRYYCFSMKLSVTFGTSYLLTRVSYTSCVKLAKLRQLLLQHTTAYCYVRWLIWKLSMWASFLTHCTNFSKFLTAIPVFMKLTYKIFGFPAHYLRNIPKQGADASARSWSEFCEANLRK